MKKLNPSIKLFIIGVSFMLVPPLIVKIYGLSLHSLAGVVSLLILFAPFYFLLGAVKAVFELREKRLDYRVLPIISITVNSVAFISILGMLLPLFFGGKLGRY